MKFVSLFSGIGGFDLGLERAGHKCVLQVEIDEFCRKVLAKHWPNVRRIADVKDVTATDCEDADLVIGGFPCQPFSVAGKRMGLEDERWLWPEFARIVRLVRPRYVLVENVPGLLAGRGMSAVVGDLAEIGYDAEWDCIPAAAVDAPHLRYRVFVVAYANGPRLEIGQGTKDRRRTIWDERETLTSRSWWTSEPDVGRVADGVPARVDRIRALGNAVVPQVAELVGRRLAELETRRLPENG